MSINCKYLSEYKRVKDGQCGRYLLGREHISYYPIYSRNDSRYSNTISYDINGNPITFHTLEEAMIATDEALLERGYTFLTDEQWDKLQVLL